MASDLVICILLGAAVLVAYQIRYWRRCRRSLQKRDARELLQSVRQHEARQ